MDGPKEFGAATGPSAGSSRWAFAYPDSPAGVETDHFHGITVGDPYRWLDDHRSPPVLQWVVRQNALTSDVLDRFCPRSAIRARLSALWNVSWSSIPARVGERTFVLQSNPGDEQPVLNVIEDGTPAVTSPLLDPNAIAADGSVALTGWTVDPAARLLAYALSRSGSDRQEIRVRSIDTGRDFPDVIRWGKSEEDLPFANVAWAPDSSGFYYNRLPAPGTVEAADTYRHSQVYWHEVGTEQDDDDLILERPDDPDLNFVPIVTGDGAYLVLHAWRGLSGRDQVLVRPLGAGGSFTSLFPEADARFLFLGNEGHRFYFHTTAGAPRGRVVAIDLGRSLPANWVEVVPEQRDPILRAFRFDGRIVLVYVRDAHHRISLFEPDGRRGPELELPEPGTVSDVGFDARANHVLVAFESFFRPRAVLRFDAASGDLVDDATPLVPFDASPYVTEQLFAPAADGTPIPVTVVHHAALVRDGRTPMLLYGYGGFNVSTTPLFDPSLLAWLERGGAYASASPRGGGEYGEVWHEAGRRRDKETVFGDFEAVAEWLVTSGYTASSRLAIRGESNGGLLVAACMLRRPDLFGAVVCSLPVTDMLRFPRYTIGHYWTHEYGEPTTDAKDFAVLRRYSPLENVRTGVDYPPILVTTGDEDDRVVPSHAMKFVACLQNASSGSSAPRLLRVQHGVGHGLGKPTSRVIELDADIFSFLLATIGSDLPQA